MIDWITCRIPCDLPRPVHGGQTVVLDQAGQIERVTPHRLKIEGSFATSLAVRAPSTSELEISGNLLKWMQGHNLYGTDDAAALLWEALQRIEPHLGATLDEIGLGTPDALSGAILTRVDCTFMLQLPTPLDVLSWIRSAHATGHATHRGRGVMKGGTLYFGHGGKSLQHWQIAIYSKGQELTDHPIPDFMMQDAEVLNWVNRCLRVEVRLFRKTLEKRGLRALTGWSPDSSGKVWQDMVARIDFNEGAAVSDLVEKLPHKLRPVYEAWTRGADVRKLCTRASFYRYRRELADLIHVDIAVPKPAEPTAEIVPIKRVLAAVPVCRPTWADRVDQQLRLGGATILPAAA